MRFVEESEGSFTAAQLAAAERELEEQKKEWELDRLRALREEEERRMRLADDDEEKPLTFGREDAQNQVNSAAANRGGSRRLVNKRLPVPSRRSSRRRGGGGNRGRARESSRSESESTTSTESESESESQEEDVIEDSLDEESSHTESQSQGDDGEGEEEGDKGEDEREEEASEGNEDGRANNHGNDTERGGGFSRRKSRLAGGTCSRNHFDLNSPRTRSRGNVQINLWTLDVSPILPGVKPNCRRQRGKKFHRAKSEENLPSSLPQCSTVVVSLKRSTRMNASIKASVNSDQNASKTDVEMAEEDRDLTSSSIDSNSMEQRVIDSSMELLVDDHVDSVTPIVKTQSGQTKITVSENVEIKEEKEKSCDKITNGTNFITACSVQMTRCLQKPSSMTSRKLGSETVNRKEDVENLDVNVSARDSRSSPSTTQSDASLKRAKETTVKSIPELLALAPVVACNYVRVKSANAVASREPEKSVESSSTRSVPLLRSKTLRSDSPDMSNDKIAKTVTVSRVTQRNSKSNVSLDDVPTSSVNDKDDDDNAEAIVESSIRKYASQKLSNSKNDTRENSDLDSEKKTSDNSVSNAVSDSLVQSAKNETNFNESKPKVRKVAATDNVAAISRGVTTRSSKIPSIVHGNSSEESNVRLTDDKIDSASEITTKTGFQQQPKVNLDARRSDVSSQQQLQQVVEQSRVTRSTATSIGRSFTPPPVSGDTPNPSLRLASKRRPDTPLPRPVTRSASSVVNNSKVPSCQDNGFVSPMPFKRDSPIPPPMKPELSKEMAIVVIERTSIHSKRRPDTPRPPSVPPNNEQVSRVTRSGLALNSAVAKVSPSQSSSASSASSTTVRTGSRQQPARESSSTSEPSSDESTDQRVSSSIPSYACEKPQRTAKVVAILTLDTRSNHQHHHHHHNNKNPSSIQSKSTVANCTSSGAETKVHDKELFVTRLSADSSKEQEAENEGYDSSSDSKSKRLRREATKRGRNAGNEDELDEDERRLKRVAARPSPPFSASATASSTQTSTRSEKLRSATIS